MMSQMCRTSSALESIRHRTESRPLRFGAGKSHHRSQGVNEIGYPEPVSKRGSSRGQAQDRLGGALVLERLDEVERAFVHLDYEVEHHPDSEHKVV